METDGGVKVHLPNTAVMAENALFQGGSVAVAVAAAAPLLLLLPLLRPLLLLLLRPLLLQHDIDVSTMWSPCEIIGTRRPDMP